MSNSRRSKHQLDQAAHRAIFDHDIAPDLFAAALPQAAPRAIVYGGQPGAGKSRSIASALAEMGNGTVPIIGDELRGYHPSYRTLLSEKDETAAFYTDADTARWVEMAIDHAKRNRFSMVIEGTMRNADKVAATMTALRDGGYAIDARVIVVKHAYSWQGVLERYETQKALRGFGRMTTADAHDAAYNGMIGTIHRIESEKLADRITLLRRNGPFYRRELVDGKWSTPRTAVTAIKDERKRPDTPTEIRHLVGGYERIRGLLERPERHASTAEITALKALKNKAEAMLIRADDPDNSKKDRGQPSTRKKKGGIDPFE